MDVTDIEEYGSDLSEDDLAALVDLIQTAYDKGICLVKLCRPFGTESQALMAPFCPCGCKRN